MRVDFLGRGETQSNPYRTLEQKLQKRPIIFLGLGGVGSSAVSELKDLYEKTFIAHMREGQETPIPPGIQFLCFDSAQTDRPTNLKPKDEWHQMVATRLDFKRLKADPFYANWLPPVSGHDYTTGAGGQRALGRVLFVRNIHRFHAELAKKMETATSYRRLDIAQPLVWVFVSLAGGTGSGSLLDACFHIRRYYSGAGVYGTLGVVGGLTGIDPRQQNFAAVGAYAALKEIDAFMAGTRLDRTYADDTPFTYPGELGIQGKYDRPFDECFLVGRENDRGITNLADRSSLAAFMARHAFLLTAYTVDTAKGQRSFESEMCDKTSQLPDRVKGAVARYSVPAVGQIHVPLNLAANYLCCKLAEKVVSALEGGHPCPDERARELVDRLGLRIEKLTETVGRRANGSPIVARDWSDDVDGSFNDKGFRYTKKGKQQILGYGEYMAAGRYEDYATEMQPVVQAKIDEVSKKIFEEVGKTLKEAACRLEGAVDLLDDLARELEMQLTHVPPVATSEQIKSDWDNIRGLVDDVCTKGSVFDLDWLKLGKARAYYVDFLNQADVKILQRAKSGHAAAALTGVMEYMRNLRAVLEEMKKTLGRTKGLVGERAIEFGKQLNREAQGTGTTAEDICSFSVLNIEWATEYARDQNRFGPDGLLTAMCAGTWSPIGLLDEGDAEHVAQAICDRIDDVETNKVRSLSLSQLFAARKPGEAGNPAVELETVIHRDTSPQLKIQAMVDRLDAPPSIIKMIGGVDEQLHRDLQSSDVLAGVSRALCWEDSKVSYAESHYPVALAGCDALVERFDPVYSEWRKGLSEIRNKQEEEIARKKFHCFEGSDTWQAPVYSREAASAEAQSVARGFAVSVIMDPQRLGAGHSAHAVVTNAIALLDKASIGPKDKRLALFTVGKQDFWLAPFFDISSPAGVGKPIRLGSTLVKASAALKQDATLTNGLRSWVSWFEEHWSEFFTAPQLAQSIDAAIDAARVALSKQKLASEDEQEWQGLVACLEDWKREMV